MLLNKLTKLRSLLNSAVIFSYKAKISSQHVLFNKSYRDLLSTMLLNSIFLQDLHLFSTCDAKYTYITKIFSLETSLAPSFFLCRSF